MADNHNSIDPENKTPDSQESVQKKTKHHLIKTTWLRRLLKTIGIILIVILLIPVALYIPPVQKFAIKVSTGMIKKSTGMDIGIGYFRLSFPLEVHLEDVTVIEAKGDTMVRARDLVADIKLLPLLKLDVDINRVKLVDGHYRMLAPDSSMYLTVDAGLLDIDDKSSVDIKTMTIDLNKTLLRNGHLGLVMDVWKKQPQPEDTASAPVNMRILARDLQLENFSFSMSMLPTIDTMGVSVKQIDIRNAEVNLADNLVKWGLAAINDGSFEYLAPDPEYVRTHPAPLSAPSSGPPMRIMGDSISLDNLNAIYGIRGAKPQPGFDPNFLKFTGVGIGLRNFYNESATVRLPLTRLEARERCGLQVLSGRGTVGIDSLGLTVDDVDISTVYSRIRATAGVPFALMALQPQAPLNAKVNARIGLPDVEAFMPTLKPMLANIPARKPLIVDLNAEGTLSDIDLPELKVEMPGVLKLNAAGSAKNPLDVKMLIARVKFEGLLADPAVADKFIGDVGFKLPAFSIDGNATANGLSYGADFRLLSDAGDVAAKGNVALTPEQYTVDVAATGFDAGRFVPTSGLGRVTATVSAHGRGFNPLSGTAVTDAIVDVKQIEYKHKLLRDIKLSALLTNAGDMTIDATSANPGLDFSVYGTGTIHNNDYRVDLDADFRDVNLQALGLTDSVCAGSARIKLVGAAQPSSWTYTADLDVTGVEWALPDRYIHLPDGLSAQVRTNPALTSVSVNSMLTNIDFYSQAGPQQVINGFTKVAELATKQLEEKTLLIDKLAEQLPHFNLNLNASGRGALGQILEGSGIGIDTVYANLNYDSLINGRVGALNLSTTSLNLDTLTLDLKQRGSLLDYRAHVGNRPGVLDEFARVNVNGYVGDNRISAYLNQWNIKGEQGYRIGLTAAYMDSIISAHITPLKSTIAYMPWQFNDDNFVEFNTHSKRIEANLTASSAESSITARTQTLENGFDELYLNIKNLHVQDFLQMWALAPPVKGDLNADMHVQYEAQRFTGHGTVGFSDAYYDRTSLGNFDINLDAGYGLDMSTDVKATLNINNDPAMALYANLRNGPDGLAPDSVGLSLTRFPLKIANPFLDNNLVLNGFLNGDMHMRGSFTKPLLNGNLEFDSVTAKIPMIGATLKLPQDIIDIRDNLVTFRDFNIYGANKNPITLQGGLDARDFSDLKFDLALNASNFQLIKSDKRSRADLYGKVFLNLGATVKGPMQRLNVNGNVNILGTTDATYRLNMETTQMATQGSEGIVKFVNFNDTTDVAKADSTQISPLNMRINADLVISPGAQFEVLLSTNGTDKVELAPTANLVYYQNYMGDMTLNGSLRLGDGFARYAVPVIGEKMFVFDPASTITFNGPIDNPILDVKASDEVKANVSDGSNSRLVNFIVTLLATNPLNNLKVAFDLSTNDDLTIQNELQSMSADQRQTQAMNLLLYGQYMGMGTKANAASGNMLYSYLESTLNSWAAKNIRGVDLSFGVNQYDKVTDGVSNTETSYSYQVSKSLFNNRFKIQVGGNYSTDSADDEIAQNLISDVAVEYIIKQNENMNMLVRLFRHIGFESVLEGEITEMGAGFVYKRHLQSLRGLFRFRSKKKNKNKNQNNPVETPVKAANVKAAVLPEESAVSNDTTNNKAL